MRARLPRGDPHTPALASRAGLETVLEDAAHTPDGQAAGLVRPRDEAEVAAALASAPRVLPIGAQSSLTGGATPRGDLVLSTAGMRRVLAIGPGHVRVQPGVTLEDLQPALAGRGLAYPPAPTFLGATAGGIVATNAAGAATFKYGTTRDWVAALTVVLASGEVLDLVRGDVTASKGVLAFETYAGRRVEVPVPTYAPPQVPKCSAGYHAAPGMDLVDLFVGSEGTLGVITEVTLRVQHPAPATCLAWIPCTSEPQALSLVRELRDASRATWRARDPHGLDVCAIEMLDSRSLALLREDGVAERNDVRLAPDTAIALLVQLDLPPGTTSAGVYDAIAAAAEPGATGPLASLCRALERHGLLEVAELAGPDERRRTSQLQALREAVPAAVNARVARAQAAVDPRITKTAADMVVPWERFEAFLAACRTAFDRLGLDHATWGHASDGNVHPNVIPRSYADVEAGRAAMLEVGRWVIAEGGSPLAEHGVGRNPVKQALLQLLYGEAGIEEMRAVKRVLDPDWKLAPGVLFPA